MYEIQEDSIKLDISDPILGEAIIDTNEHQNLKTI